MKISYRNSPILKMLATDKPEFRIDSRNAKKDEVASAFMKYWKCNRELFSKNIIIVSENFANSAYLCRDKMIANKLYEELPFPLSGTLIIKNIAYVYNCSRESVDGVGATKINLIEFAYGNAITIMATDQYKYLCADAIKESIEQGFSDVNAPVKGNWDFIQTCLLFKHFADVEEKIVNKASKLIDFACKYVNETDYKITFLDSHWANTLVRSDGFNVRGHFRLQACGEAMKKRKLIWINDFEKTGYTAPARKLAVGI